MNSIKFISIPKIYFLNFIASEICFRIKLSAPARVVVMFTLAQLIYKNKREKLKNINCTLMKALTKV